MASPISKMKEIPVITHHQKFEGHTDRIWGALYLPGGQRIITCSLDGSLRVWNVKSGKQIGDDWKDGDSEVWSIALSPDGKKVVSGSDAVRLWDIDTCKVVKKWGHTEAVTSVCWSRDGRRVLSGFEDGTARQWEVESGETMPEPIETGHDAVYAVVYSPDTTLFATGGRDGTDGPYTEQPIEPLIKIWDAKTGKLVATLKGHTGPVWCLAWTKDGKTLISGSSDSSIRTWNTTNWQQSAVLLDDHTNIVTALAISPNDRILASASFDNTARLWNLDNGQPISSPLQHSLPARCASFSADGKLLATGCCDTSTYTWDVAAIVQEAGLDDLLLDSNAKKSAHRTNVTRPPIQIRPPPNRIPRGFFNGVPPAHSSARSPNPSVSTFLSGLFNRSPSSVHPLDWAHNLFSRHRQSSEGIEWEECGPAVVEVPYAKGKRRNACAREQRKPIKLPLKNSTADSSQPQKHSVTQPSSQPQAADPSLSTTPAVGNATTATSPAPPSRPHAMIRHAGLWTRFWLFIGCISPDYMDCDK